MTSDQPSLLMIWSPTRELFGHVWRNWVCSPHKAMLKFSGTPYTFESESHLQRIEEFTFSDNGLKSIVISSSVEILCESCFFGYDSVESIIFQNSSKLVRIESRAFHKCSAFVIMSKCSFSWFRAVTNCQIDAPMKSKSSSLIGQLLSWKSNE
jgi:hypothetical protein